MKPSRDIPDDLLGVAETLESHRPQLSALDADRIKRRAMAAGTRTRTSTKGTFMRSRLAITTMLAFGLLMTGSGAALGVSALSTSESASVAQYGQGAVDQDDEAVLGDGGEEDEQVLGETAEGDEQVLGDVAQGGEGAGDEGVAGTAAGGGAGPTAAAQPSRQLEAGGGGGELPFTGYAAIPTLLIGMALLAMGLVLRRRPGRTAA